MGGGEYKVGPHLVRDEEYPPLLTQAAYRFNLLPGPDPAGGVVGGAENEAFDVLLLNTPVHILQVNAEYAVFVLDQRGTYQAAAGVGDRLGEAVVVGQMDQHRVAGLGEGLNSGDHAPQSGVLAADIFRLKVCDPVPVLCPLDDGLGKTGVWVAVAKDRVLQPGPDLIQYTVWDGEIHIGNPHRAERLVRGGGVAWEVPLFAKPPAVDAPVKVVHGEAPF